MPRHLASSIAALGLILMLAGPALAVEISQTMPISSQDFGVHRSNCHGVPTQDQLDWHFVLTQSTTDGQTLTVTFQNAGTITVAPDEVTGTYPYTLHYDVYTNGDDILLSASTSSDTGILVLKDICGNLRSGEINQPLPISSQDFGVQTGDCHGTPTQDQLDWHFVLNQSDTGDQTLTVTFQNSGTITVSPDQVAGHTLHYDVYTNGDDTIQAASVSGTGILVLGDICRAVEH
jgi:hypothetical protein